MIRYSEIKKNGFVDMWDLGPQRPIPPTPLEQPKLNSKNDADNVLLRLQHEDAIRDYEAQLRQYGREKAEFDAWRKDVGGPRKVEMWLASALEVMERQANGMHPFERYVQRLPAGVKPGKAQVEADAREAAEAEFRKRALDDDPHFGTEATESRRPVPVREGR